MLEAHFTSLPIQSSIYGITCLGRHTVLVASFKRKVYFVDCSRNNENHLIASMKEVAFTYIPAGAEIISIDAFQHECYGYIVGITLTKCESDGKQSQHFNIYSAWEADKECDLTILARGCITLLPLDFIPFHLTHHNTFTDKGNMETVWLLSGGDNKVHVYKEDDAVHQIFVELENANYFFPEFKDLNSVALWMDFVSTLESRVTAFGCEDGHVILTIITFQPEVKVNARWSIEHDGPISCVQLFQDSSLDLENVQKVLHLVTCNTLEVSVVYRDVLKNGLSLSNQSLLPHSGKYDNATCCCIADIDMDGENEILIGTYGQQLLAYKWTAENSYALFYQQAFSNPVLAITYFDITRDGLKEILVLSLRGLHILQHNLKKITEFCIQQLKQKLLE